MKAILLSLLSFCTGLFAQEPDTYAYVTLPAETFLARLEADPSIQLVDVRTPKEYAAGKIRDAVNIDVRDSLFTQNATQQLDKARPVAVYCKGGVRSRQAAQQLSALGFQVYNLDKGYDSVKP